MAPFVLFDMGIGYEKPWLPLALFFGAPVLLAIPSLAMAVRRLHDSNRSGWWVLLVLVCGYFILFYWFVQKPHDERATEVF